MANTVMITGAAGTLGKAVAAAFAATGAKLVLVDIAAEGLARAYGADSDTQILLAVDLGDAASVAAAVKKATDKFGPIGALCNVAGGFAMGPSVHETDDK